MNTHRVVFACLVMPSFRESELSDAEVAQIVTYLKTIK